MKTILDDPKLTAYALGELSGKEMQDMKDQVDKNSEATKYVEEIQQTAMTLSDGLKTENDSELGSEATRLSVAQREKILVQTQKKSLWTRFYIPVATAAMVVLCMTFVIQRPGLKKTLTTGTETVPVTSLPPVKPTVEAPVESPPNEGDPSDSEMAPYKYEEENTETRTKDQLIESEQLAGSGQLQMDAAAPAPRADAKKMVGSASGSITSYGGGSARYLGKGGVGPQLRKSKMSEESGNTESYSHFSDNEFKLVANDPLSTFSIDVDTASYANIRRFLVNSQKPQIDSVRIEEMINYFNYDYAAPTNDKPFAVHVEMAHSPWTKKNQLVRVALKGKEIPSDKRPTSNLIFLLDTSGSMMDSNKLPLVQKSLKMLVENMRENDRISIVTYAGSSGVLLNSTNGTQKQKINEAIDSLTAGGSTNGASGIDEAYRVATQNFIKGGINRVILATDGDFNVGTTSEGDLIRLIEEKAKSGVFLSVLGFGMGNYKDSMMVKLADKGNGNYAYIDSLREARKALVEQAGGTLHTIAKDVKIQVEFNPKYVNAYRLIGYEKRKLNNEDFNDDTKDAGEIGAGHTVTALYEVVPFGVEIPASGVDALKYQKPKALEGQDNGEALNVKIRFKKPDGNKSELIQVPLRNSDRTFESASSDFKFATSVAGFGMILRKSKFVGDFTIDKAIEIANQNKSLRGKPDEYRQEFVELMKKAKSLK
jgi:Ca-activated chloride channel family protein